MHMPSWSCYLIAFGIFLFDCVIVGENNGHELDVIKYEYNNGDWETSAEVRYLEEAYKYLRGLEERQQAKEEWLADNKQQAFLDKNDPRSADLDTDEKLMPERLFRNGYFAKKKKKKANMWGKIHYHHIDSREQNAGRTKHTRKTPPTNIFLHELKRGDEARRPRVSGMIKGSRSTPTFANQKNHMVTDRELEQILEEKQMESMPEFSEEEDLFTNDSRMFTNSLSKDVDKKRVKKSKGKKKGTGKGIHDIIMEPRGVVSDDNFHVQEGRLREGEHYKSIDNRRIVKVKKVRTTTPHFDPEDPYIGIRESGEDTKKNL